jgi:ubiquinone biosynthesis protein
MNESPPDLSSLAGSPWLAAEPGLLAAATELKELLRAERKTLADHASQLARPGPVSPRRALQHLGAMTAARWRWQYGRLPTDLVRGRVTADPAGYAKATAARLVRDHLTGLGAAAAETSHIIESSEGLLPAVIVDEVKARPARVAPVAGVTVEAIVTRAFGERLVGIEAAPVTATAVSQIHRATLAEDGRQVLVRVRRPRVDRDLHADARITASLVATLERLVPAVAGVHPLGFVELPARQTLEEGDLRNEAANAVELGISVEAMGLEDTIRIAHPLPGLADPRAVVFEDIGGVPLQESGGDFDIGRVLRGFLALSVESALLTGVFHADLRAENLVLGSDGRLGVIGYGTVGHFDLAVRRGALRYLTSIFTGDVDGQIEGLRMTGAVPPEVDLPALARDLAATEALQPMQMMTGGQEAIVVGLKEAVALLLRHQLRPPLEVTLFVRNVFALNAFIRRFAPESNLMMAMMPLVQKLPDMAAALE